MNNSTVLHWRMTPEDKHQLAMLADRYGVNMTGMVRLLLRTAYENLPAPGVLREQPHTQEKKTHG